MKFGYIAKLKILQARVYLRLKPCPFVCTRYHLEDYMDSITRSQFAKCLEAANLCLYKSIHIVLRI